MPGPGTAGQRNIGTEGHRTRFRRAYERGEAVAVRGPMRFRSPCSVKPVNSDTKRVGFHKLARRFRYPE